MLPRALLTDGSLFHGVASKCTSLIAIAGVTNVMGGFGATVKIVCVWGGYLSENCFTIGILFFCQFFISFHLSYLSIIASINARGKRTDRAGKRRARARRFRHIDSVEGLHVVKQRKKMTAAATNSMDIFNRDIKKLGLKEHWTNLISRQPVDPDGIRNVINDVTSVCVHECL